jgi:DtxR family Mn-dependent transcriptional regulator
METSDSVQDYLKSIYALEQTGDDATTTAIAARLSVSPASVTAMVKKLADRGHLQHERYRGVRLTASGRKLAEEVIRHHRLIEAYLHRVLGMSWDEVHDEAEKLEHAISERFEDRIAEVLGHPTHDPHGDPIPPKNGKHVEVMHPTLEAAEIGPAEVKRVSDRDPEALRYLAKLGITPGTLIEIEEQDPFGGPVWVKVRNRRHPIGKELAETIYVATKL